MTRLGFVLALAACSPVEVPMEMPDAMIVVDADSPLCTPSTFLECIDPNTARSCDDLGEATVDTDCGAPGCNAAAERCNACAPLTTTCNGTAVRPCDADGLVQPDVPCPLSCVEPIAGSAHCAYLEPKYLPDVCDVPAVEPSLIIDSNGTFDTSLNANCNGGVMSQAQSPALCVVRYGTFRINGPRTLKVTGSRALAIVTDGSLEILGTLDISSDMFTNGPGGGTVSSGSGSGLDEGGGGAGFVQAGADGGSDTTDGGADNGGPTLDPLTLASLVGGPRATFSVFSSTSGASGGAATLVSCRGTVTVSGTIDAGGGGGQGGFDEINGAGTSLYGGGGGGAGGQVVFQGLDVNITGNLFANGGGGGGGAADDVSGAQGGDGERAVSAASPGSAAAAAGAGGAGGFRNGVPGTGKHDTGVGAPGGGGGSMGYFFTYVPDGVTPVLSPAMASPALSVLRRVATR